MRAAVSAIPAPLARRVSKVTSVALALPALQGHRVSRVLGLRALRGRQVVWAQLVPLEVLQGQRVSALPAPLAHKVLVLAVRPALQALQAQLVARRDRRALARPALQAPLAHKAPVVWALQAQLAQLDRVG